MKSIAVIGPPEFSLGFRLAGIRNVVEDVAEIGDMLRNENLGVVIMDESVMAKLDEHLKEEVIKSNSPVFVVVSRSMQQDELRKMIKQSIGVDLMER